MIVGIDEVGRGPWAGPLVFGAVVLGDAGIDGLTDSKKLTKKKRELYDQQIRNQAVAWALGWVHAGELDELGLAKACSVACRRALEQISVPYDQIIIDGTVNFLADTGKGRYVTTMKQADLIVPSVSAASIIAKVARDKYMQEKSVEMPHYGFASHVGYGTKVHREALLRHGVSGEHRQSFAPITALMGKAIETNEKPKPSRSTKKVGDRAELAACQYLESKGFQIIARNWKTKWCEIDIVAERGVVVYFVEVKYRKKQDQGGGIAAITPSKLNQMRFAAELWMQSHGVRDAQLSAAEVAGEDFTVSQFLEQVRL